VLVIFPALVSPRNTARGSSSTNKGQGALQQRIAAGTQSVSRPLCETAGHDQITIACSYAAIPRDYSKDRQEPWIVLDRFTASFNARRASQMHLELTFTNGGRTRVSDARVIYLEMDDDAGSNYVRRILPQVDFRKLGPGESRTFSERLFVGAFMPRRYFFRLWIPNPDPSLKFNFTYNFLLGNESVSDSSTGLNTLAELRVTDEDKR
jgi:hypothetical protein